MNIIRHLNFKRNKNTPRIHIYAQLLPYTFKAALPSGYGMQWSRDPKN